MNTWFSDGIFTIELVNQKEREAMIRQIGGIPTGSLVDSQFAYDMARKLDKELKKVSGK